MMEALGAGSTSSPSPTRSAALGRADDYVAQLCASDERYVWLNQYTNPNNWMAHYRTTAPAIAAQFPDLDVLFVGAGTTGTLMGCARYFREWHRPVRIVAVDAVGSVTFGGAPGRRMIPGLGMASVRRCSTSPTSTRWCMSRRWTPSARATAWPEAGSCSAARPERWSVARSGWLAAARRRNLTAVAIAPDLGERYLDTVYQTNWLLDLYGEDVLTSPELATSSQAA